MTLNNSALIKKDRLRFTKNKLSATLTYFSIVLDCLYFISIYSSNKGNYYYNWLMGVSVVYNLLFLLFSFLASEGVKEYKMSYSYLLVALGMGQIARIFIFPMRAHSATLATNAVATSGAEGAVTQAVNELVMKDGQFIYCISLLIGSAALCIIAAVVGMIKSATLAAHVAELGRRGSRS